MAVALGFHVGLIALTQVDIEPRKRVDRIDPRVVWVGDKVVLEEDTLLGQLLRIGNDTPLFLITSQNFASTPHRSEDSRRPGEIFSSYDPILTVPKDGGPPGLVVPPTDTLEPESAVRRFRWPYLARFGRADPVARTFEARRARIEIRSVDTGAVVLAESLPLSNDRETPEIWPDWRPFELHLSVSEVGRVAGPALVGGGSGSDRVDQFILDHVRRRMRLDMRLGPGSYRIFAGP